MLGAPLALVCPFERVAALGAFSPAAPGAPMVVTDPAAVVHQHLRRRLVGRRRPIVLVKDYAGGWKVESMKDAGRGGGGPVLSSTKLVDLMGSGLVAPVEVGDQLVPGEEEGSRRWLDLMRGWLRPTVTWGVLGEVTDVHPLTDAELQVVRVTSM